MDRDVEGFLSVRPQSARHLVRSPAAARALKNPVHLPPAAETDPIQLNVEITSRCNLSCGHCARSRLKRPGKDMDRDAFCCLLDLMPNTLRVTLVGLGEPTLHPQVVDFVAIAARRGHRVGLVTNAMALDRTLSRQLIAAGVGSLAFSLDSVNADLLARVRPGSDLDRIVGNIEGFVQAAGGKIPTSVFTAVSRQTVGHLPELAGGVAGLGVDAWMLSDLNFQWNRSETLRDSWTPAHEETVGNAVKRAFSNSLPAVSVRGIEELGLATRYRDFLITSPRMLGRRSRAHRWCLSPWQTLPVNVDGSATVCDCRPRALLGNLFEHSFSDIWNGAPMQSHRRRMHSAAPPADCLACPRF
jgi:MoaA/NifB/PqqE/SkfB family radical SAM enzyme